VDGVGKTSLRMLLSNYNDGNLYIIERFTPSVYAYGRFFGRKLDVDYLHLVEEGFMKSFSPYPVLLRCDPKVLHGRFARGRHSTTFSLEEIDLIQEIMEDYVRDLSALSWLVVDNTSLTPEETFKAVVRWLRP
jgi:thymidylate kinase